MFCPKCGANNPEKGKFCRSCGTDLSPVSDALAGRSNNKNLGFGMIEPLHPMNFSGKKQKSVSWESMLSTLFVGFAFLVIAVVLGITGAANARQWWFWLLIPGFSMLGTSIAQYIQLKKYEQKSISHSERPEAAKSLDQTSNKSLPPKRAEYVSVADLAPDSRYKTGDLAPPSVVEGTTRHLEMNSEGETMTLPRK